MLLESGLGLRIGAGSRMTIVYPRAREFREVARVTEKRHRVWRLARSLVSPIDKHCGAASPNAGRGEADRSKHDW